MTREWNIKIIKKYMSKNTQEKEEIKIQDTPPNPQIRNEFGLIKGLNYVFTEDNAKVDWRKMLDDKYLVPNRANFIKFNKEIPKTIEGLEDKDMVVLLQGFRTLADIRGYTDVNYDIVNSSKDYCCVKCTIKWVPNFESSMIEYSSTADAHWDSVDGIFKNYLVSMAENRAFQRTIRNALKINICARDEIGPVKEENNNSSPQSNPQVEILENLLSKKNITFDQFKKVKLIPDKVPGAENMKSLNELPRDIIFNYISRLKSKEVNKE